MNAVTLLSSLLYTLDDAIALNNRLKLSAFERDLAQFIVEHHDPKLHEKPLIPYQILILKSKIKPSDAKKMVVELLKYNNSAYLEDIVNWDIPKFPITGAMLKERGVEPGRLMGLVMAELKNYWIDMEFPNEVDKMLQFVPDILVKLEEKKKKK